MLKFTVFLKNIEILVSENYKPRQEVNVTLDKLVKKDCELSILTNSVRKTASYRAHEPSFSQNGEYEINVKFTTYGLINHFSTILQCHNDLIQYQRQKIHDLQVAPGLSNKKFSVRKMSEVEHDYEHAKCDLRARNEKLDSFVNELKRNLYKHSCELQIYASQLNVNLDSNKNNTELILKKEKENTDFKKVIMELKLKNFKVIHFRDKVRKILLNKNNYLSKTRNVIDKLNKQPSSNPRNSESYKDCSLVNSGINFMYSKLNAVFNRLVLGNFDYKDVTEILYKDCQTNLKSSPINLINQPDDQTEENLPIEKSHTCAQHPTEDVKKISQPPSRPLISMGRPNKTNPICNIRIMCYNVLCNTYATQQMFEYCPSWALTWEHRKKLLLSEIKENSADIICLQEVEPEQFYKFFLPELKQDGYSGIFCSKSKRRFQANKKDGCAIFYKILKFTLIREYVIELNHLAECISDGSDHMRYRVIPRDNIGLAALLVTNEAAWSNGLPQVVNQPLLVCTTHIYSNPDFRDVKIIQVMMLMYTLRKILDELEYIMYQQRNANPLQVPLLFCGDLNDIPQSGAVEFLSSGRVSPYHPDFRGLDYRSVLQKISDNDNPNEFTHSFKLTSAYGADVMPFTNYTENFKNVIDYIFYSKKHMRLISLLGPLDPEWLKENNVVGAPHPFIPSDHFPIVALLEMMPSNSKKLVQPYKR